MKFLGIDLGWSQREQPSLQFSLCPGRSCGSILTEIPSSVATLKALEDRLDSIICAYVAAHWWYWGDDRNLVLGDRATGYIVIPI